MQVRLAGLTPDSIVDGPGYRLAVFTQGCPHGCPGCHNPHTHAFEGGEWKDTDDILAMVKKNPLCDGITLTGGEPLCQAEALKGLAAQVQQLGLTVVTYTGYTLEDLLQENDPHRMELLAHTDLLIDGPFILARRTLEAPFRGSANQRLLDMPASLQAGAPVPADLKRWLGEY